MTLGELLQRAYGVAMTPLPASWLPEVDPGAVKARLASMLPGPADVSGLPQMPAAWAEYARRQGLYPEQQQQGAARGVLGRLQAGHPQWQPIGNGMEQLDPVSVERYNQYFGGQR